MSTETAVFGHKEQRVLVKAKCGVIGEEAVAGNQCKFAWVHFCKRRRNRLSIEKIWGKVRIERRTKNIVNGGSP